MTWVYLTISIGAAGFLVWIIIDYLNASSGLKPKADVARQEIRECEARIEAEQNATNATKDGVEGLQKEIAELGKRDGRFDEEGRGVQTERKAAQADQVQTGRVGTSAILARSEALNSLLGSASAATVDRTLLRLRPFDDEQFLQPLGAVFGG